MEHTVSVIVPVYNVNRYIEESIESICKQEFKGYEVIVINDGTKDNSIELAKKILEKYKVDYKIVNKENGGLPSARNVGIKVASGKYVCFIDSDDIISNNHLQNLYSLCEKEQLEASYALFQLTYEDNRAGCPSYENEPKVIERNELLHGFLLRKYRIHCCTLMIRREYLEKENIYFDEKLRYGEDIDFMWRLFPTLKAVGCTGNKTYMYLQRTNSLMSSQNVDRVKILLDVFGKTVETQKNNYPDDMDIWEILFGKAALAFYRTFAESSEYGLFKQLLDETNYKRNICPVLKIHSFKLRILALCLLLSPKLFVRIVKLNQETAASN